MSKARALYRDYYIDLEEDAQLWRVAAIMHRITGQTLLPPGFNYADRATVEQYAKAAIDLQVAD